MAPLLHIISLASLLSGASAICIRGPREATRADKHSGTNGFHVEIKSYPRNDSAPEPQGYVPGELYTIVLRGYRTKYVVQTFRGFSLVAVPAGKNIFSEPVGKFNSLNAESKSSQDCWHALTQTTLHPKSEVEVTWRAPDKNVGCVDFRAMVLEYTDTWYMDDGNLTRKFCQLNKTRRVIVGPKTVNPDDSAAECCACDEAKYELMFEGHWSKETHPKDFPTQVQLTHFSDLIGASHSSNFRMWAYGDYASDGMKELAEWGNTYRFEQELKNEAKEIRTIIKARGLWYPHVQGTAKAMFRVDKYHHLMSLASMLGPSPDWVVGVNGINLCLPDCSWVGERSFNLMPFDAGTDAGDTYMSPNNPERPRKPIKPISTKDNENGPFYDPYKDKMRPLATLTLRRQATYPMECKSDAAYQNESLKNISSSEDDEYANRRECAVHDWTPWSLCSATCGKGIRMRSRNYRFAMKAQMFNCERQITEKQFCSAELTVCEDEDFGHQDCRETQWTSWSDCSVTCGEGTRSRTRNYRDPPAAEVQRCRRQLLDTEQCTGIDGAECQRFVDPMCRMTQWSNWSPCSASCGEGKTVRTRLYLYSEQEQNCPVRPKMEAKTCELITCANLRTHYGSAICKQEVEEGQCRGSHGRFYFNEKTNTCERFIYTGCKGNQNNFRTIEACWSTCKKDYEPDVQLEKSNSISNYGAVGIQTEGKVVSPPYRNELEERIRESNGGRSYRHQNEVYPVEESAKTLEAEATFGKLSLEEKGRKHWEKVIKSEIARELGVPSIDTYISDMKNGMICVPANHLADALGIKEVNDGGERVDCMTTEWSFWSDCSKTCGNGKRQRTRSISVFPRNGGTPCPDKLRMQRRCNNLRPCPRRPKCKVTPWTEWSACSAACGNGQQLRSRKVTKERKRRKLRHLGTKFYDCRTTPSRERKPCKIRDC